MKAAMTRKKKIGIVFLCIFLVLLVLYGILFWNTRPVITKVESIFKGEVPAAELAGSCLEEYNITATRPEITEMDIDVDTLFTIHNFSEGYMWVEFSCIAYNSAGEVAYGEISKARWEIEKIDGEWEVVAVRQNVKGW